MKILHTADWHIGQLFFAYDRTYEHQQFLDWLVNTVVSEQADVLLISGDVFDVANPSAAAVKMFYRFLNKVTNASPGLQVVVTAGNHDSAARLEAPTPLLESSNIHLVGVVKRKEDGTIDYDQLIIPLYNKRNEVEILCLAVPFLRLGDYPVTADAGNSYTEGVAALYRELTNHAAQQLKPDQYMIAMGHMHVQQAETTEMDKAERPIMGGVEGVSATAFPPGLRYIALGHIHKAQAIDPAGIVRYAGSPLPMSFSETNYQHQILSIQINRGVVQSATSIPVPVTIPLQRIPQRHATLEHVLTALQQLPAATGDLCTAPYLEVRVLLNGPEPSLRYTIESILKDKQVRLAKIDTRIPAAEHSETSNAAPVPEALAALHPVELLSRLYYSRYNTAIPESLLALFHEVVTEVNAKEQQA